MNNNLSTSDKGWMETAYYVAAVCMGLLALAVSAVCLLFIAWNEL